MKIYYEDVLVGQVLTNRSLTVKEALEAIGFDEETFLRSQGWEAIDYNEFKLDYSETPTTLVGLSEAAEMLDWSKQHLSIYIQRGKFPEPIQRLASGPIWKEQQIIDFKNTRT